jgi:hypothetical protein
MATVVTERRRRGVFGWFFAAVFWLWQLLMVAWIISGVGAVSNQTDSLHTNIEKNAAAAGLGIGIILIIFLWAAGSVVFAILMFFTRGRMTFVTTET